MEMKVGKVVIRIEVEGREFEEEVRYEETDQGILIRWDEIERVI